MSYCICCNSPLLRHIRHGEVYWYCPDCRQEMPEADSNVVDHSESTDRRIPHVVVKNLKYGDWTFFEESDALNARTKSIR